MTKGSMFVLALLALLTVAITVACDNTTTTTPPAATAAPAAPTRFKEEFVDMGSGSTDMRIYTDTKTGCEFFALVEGSGNAATYIPHTCKADSTLEVR
jgi:hypothetical protein